jgi:MATE family multidrug resistance protein
VPALGIVGAGYATATIQWSMALGLTLLLLTLPRQTTLRLPRQIAQRVRAILRLGLPIGGLIALEVGVFAVAGILMGLFGTDALAAHQLALNVASLTFMIPLGIGQAATVRVAFELGASAPRAAHLAGVVALLVGVIIMMACGLLIWMAPRAIARVYLDLQDPANHVTSVIVLEFLAVAAVFQVFDGIQVIAAGALRGHRDTAVPLLIAAFGYWGVGFTGGWLLAFPLSCGPGNGLDQVPIGIDVGTAQFVGRQRRRSPGKQRHRLRDVAETVVRARVHGAHRRRGTEGSNPAPSSGESRA